MKISKDIQAQARRLFRLCVGEDGLPQEDTIRRVSAAIVERKPRHSVELLTAFTSLVRLAQARRTATITSAIPLTGQEKDAIRTRLDARRPGLLYRWEMNPALIAGLTVRVGDDVTDASVRSRIERLTHL